MGKSMDVVCLGRLALPGMSARPGQRVLLPEGTALGLIRSGQARLAPGYRTAAKMPAALADQPPAEDRKAPEGDEPKGNKKKGK